MNKELIRDVAEYIPDVFVNGMDCPDSQTAEEIIALCQQDFLKRALDIFDKTRYIYHSNREIKEALKAEFEK